MRSMMSAVIDFLLPSLALRRKSLERAIALLQVTQADRDRSVQAALDQAKREIQVLDGRLNDARLDHHQKKVVAPSLLLNIDHLPQIGSTAPISEEGLYAAFEKIYYDSATVAVNQRVYMPFLPIAKGKGAIDLGSGRGEFMQILTEFGWKPIGFDLNTVQCEIARAKGLSVSCIDLIEGLDAAKNESVDLITALQVVEHMSPAAVKRVLKRSNEVLVPKGKIIVETVNPLSPYALSHFWLDETHVRPVCSYWIEFYLSQYGFTEIQTLYQDPVPTEWRTDSVLSNYSNYAVIATKP